MWLIIDAISHVLDVFNVMFGYGGRYHAKVMVFPLINARHHSAINTAFN